MPAKSRTRSREELMAERRKVRHDTGTYKDVMTVPEEPGLWFRWVNDVEDGARVAQFLKLGWRLYDGDNVPVGDANQTLETNVSPGAGAVVVAGKGVKAVLMCIDKEIWDMDQEIKQESIDATEQAMGMEAKNRGADWARIDRI